jgi:Tfp pilus assembly protein PilZ
VKGAIAEDRTVHTEVDPRFRKRLPCRLKVGGSSHSAMVLNVSRGGLFVQTGAGPAPGASVSIDLDLASHAETVPIGGRVVWRRVVAPHLRSVTQGGVGIRIESAAEAYYTFLAKVAGESSPAEAARREESAEPAVVEPQPEAPKLEYRVRVKQEGGPRSRALTLLCETEEVARDRALSIVGKGWAILELERTDG